MALTSIFVSFVFMLLELKLQLNPDRPLKGRLASWDPIRMHAVRRCSHGRLVLAEGFLLSDSA